MECNAKQCLRCRQLSKNYGVESRTFDVQKNNNHCVYQCVLHLADVMLFSGFQRAKWWCLVMLNKQLVYTKTVDSVEGALWFAGQTPNILCYFLRATREKMASWFASVTSEEIIQINLPEKRISLCLNAELFCCKFFAPLITWCIIWFFWRLVVLVLCTREIIAIVAGIKKSEALEPRLAHRYRSLSRFL